MRNPIRMVQVRRLMLIALGGLATYLLVPMILSRYDDIKSLREARLTRAVKFGDRNAEFTNRIHVEATMLEMFAQHNDRMNISGTELKEARQELYENFRKAYLEIDTEWWWPWEFVREVGALRLLSPDEMTQLHAYVQDYTERVKPTVYKASDLWHFLDSSKYKVGGKESQAKIVELQKNMNDTFEPENEKRAELVQKIAALLANSNFRCKWHDIVGLPW